MTIGQDDEIQTVTCTCTSCAGTYKLKFRGQWTRSIAHDASTSTVEAALEALSTIDDVTVSGSASACDASGTAVHTITFTRQHGDLPDLQYDTSSLTTTPTIAIATPTTGTKESIECSGRGLCDTSTGLCGCYGTFASSDGKGAASGVSGGTAGTVNDCGYQGNAVTACPGTVYPCTNYGTCSDNAEWLCTCDEGFLSGNCAKRACPYGKAWFDEALSNDIAHQLAECSNMGTCDRGTGTCTCRDGFSGAACDKLACPVANSMTCNGKGRCVTNRELQAYQTVNGASQVYAYGSDPNDNSLWDADQIRSCMCSESTMKTQGGRARYAYAGHDCTRRVCPYGDDPNTKSQVDEVQTFACTATAGSFTITFRDKTTAGIPWDAPASGDTIAMAGTSTINLVKAATTHNTNGNDYSTELSTGSYVRIGSVNYEVASVTTTTVTFTTPWPLSTSATESVSRVLLSVEDALEALDTIGSVTVSFAASKTKVCDTATTSITFLTEHGDVPQITTTDTGLTGAGISSLGTTTTGTKESTAECSNHGICDQETGTCKCFKGYASSDGQGNAGPLLDCGQIHVDAPDMTGVV